MRGGMQLCGSQTPNGEVWNQQWEGGKAADNNWGRGRRGLGWACATGNHTYQHRCCVLCAKPSSLTLPGGWIYVRSRPVEVRARMLIFQGFGSRILQPLPRAHRFHPGEKRLKTCCPSASPGSCLWLWTASDLLISTRLFSMFQSVSQEWVFAEIFFFFPHSTEMWNTPTIFHTIWEVQRFFSNLCRHW